MKRLLLSIICFFSIYFGFSQRILLSDDAKISVLTVGPGTSLYDAFGHNAFRIQDKNKRIDLTFGYGEYDFDDPNFYVKFAQGKLNYLLSQIRYANFYNYYISQNRTIDEQVLNLSQDQQQALFNYLLTNYKPENRRYLYDFFYDNCATRMRDVTKIAIKDSIGFNVPSDFQQKTFRNLIHDHVNRNSWGSFGIDLALGSVVDRPASSYEYMFLPKYIHDFFAEAQLSNGESLVTSSQQIYKSSRTSNRSTFFLSPLFILGLVSLLIIYITYQDNQLDKRSKWMDVSIFAITGIAGIIMLLLWFATDHTATAHNYNLLWAFPLNLIVLFPLLKSVVHVRVVKYIKLLVILLCLLCLHWMVGVQVYAIGLIPILIALVIRYVFLIRYFNKQLESAA